MEFDFQPYSTSLVGNYKNRPNNFGDYLPRFVALFSNNKRNVFRGFCNKHLLDYLNGLPVSSPHITCASRSLVVYSTGTAPGIKTTHSLLSHYVPGSFPSEEIPGARAKRASTKGIDEAGSIEH